MGSTFAGLSFDQAESLKVGDKIWVENHDWFHGWLIVVDPNFGTGRASGANPGVSVKQRMVLVETGDQAKSRYVIVLTDIELVGPSNF